MTYRAKITSRFDDDAAATIWTLQDVDTEQVYGNAVSFMGEPHFDVIRDCPAVLRRSRVADASMHREMVTGCLPVDIGLAIMRACHPLSSNYFVE